MKPLAKAEGFAGDLAALSFVELVQTLANGGKTARLQVRSDSHQGELWFKDGQLIHAQAGALFGDLAVYALIELNSGYFAVEYGSTTDARSITQDVTFLMLEGLRRLDERSADPAPSSAPVEVAPALEANVRRERSRRRAVRVTVAAMVLGAALAASVYAWRSPSPVDAVAAVTPLVAQAPAVVPAAPPRPTPVKRSTPSRAVPKKTVVVVPETVPSAPESAAAEEPVPLVAAVAPPATGAATVAVDKPPRLRISGKSGSEGGRLTVFVDGAPKYTLAQLTRSEPFDGEIELTPGAHVIAARLEDGARAGVHEVSTFGVFAQGESRLLQITANRMFGSAVKVKLEEER